MRAGGGAFVQEFPVVTDWWDKRQVYAESAERCTRGLACGCVHSSVAVFIAFGSELKKKKLRV